MHLASGYEKKNYKLYRNTKNVMSFNNVVSCPYNYSKVQSIRQNILHDVNHTSR